MATADEVQWCDKQHGALAGVTYTLLHKAGGGCTICIFQGQKTGGQKKDPGTERRGGAWGDSTTENEGKRRSGIFQSSVSWAAAVHPECYFYVQWDWRQQSCQNCDVQAHFPQRMNMCVRCDLAQHFLPERRWGILCSRAESWKLLIIPTLTSLVSAIAPSPGLPCICFSSLSGNGAVSPAREDTEWYVQFRVRVLLLFHL